MNFGKHSEDGKTIGGLLVVERAFPFLQTVTGREEVLAKYRGVEGMPWPEYARKMFKISCGLAMLEEFSEILKYFVDASKESKCDLLYVQSNGVPTRNDSPLSGFNFFGYDFGNYISEHNFFSVVFNEVLFGKYEEMRQFASRLNQNLLFSKEDDVEELKKVREWLVKNGADLESFEADEEFCGIKIYCWGNALMRRRMCD